MVIGGTTFPKASAGVIGQKLPRFRLFGDTASWLIENGQVLL